MASLMSIFDPSSFFSLNWLVALSCLSFLGPKTFWVFPSKLEKFQKVVFFTVKKMYSSILSLCITTLMVVILIINLSGLLPFVFSPSSHFIFNFSLAFWFWLAGVGYGLNWNLELTLAHFTPQGAPLGLTPFLVLIEIVSFVIRPLTLALRLMSNVMAGHMILSLLALGCSKLVSMSWFLLGITSFFTLFEMGVALIQAYVFSNLTSLYWEENLNKH